MEYVLVMAPNVAFTRRFGLRRLRRKPKCGRSDWRARQNQARAWPGVAIFVAQARARDPAERSRAQRVKRCYVQCRHGKPHCHGRQWAEQELRLSQIIFLIATELSHRVLIILVDL